MKDNNNKMQDKDIKANSETLDFEPLFRVTGVDDVEEETLFGATTQDLEYVEPQKIDETVGYAPLFEDAEETGHTTVFSDSSVAGVTEEELDFVMPTESAQAPEVETEALFSADAIEDVEDVSNPEILEEGIEFVEPVVLDLVKEESLFGQEESSESQVYDFDDSIVEGSTVSDIEFIEVEKIKTIYKDKKFAEKIFEQDPIILSRYDELKNIILSYKGVKSRISNNYDSFNKGRLQLFKLATSGKSLKLYLNLEYAKVETRLKCKDVSDRNCYKEVPVLLRIKSDRAMRNAKYLINIVAEKYGLVPNKKAKKVDSIKLLKEYIGK